MSSNKKLTQKEKHKELIDSLKGRGNRRAFSRMSLSKLKEMLALPPPPPPILTLKEKKKELIASLKDRGNRGAFSRMSLSKLKENVKDIYNKFKFQKDMIFGKKEKKIYEESTHCHICHYTGQFRGAAHNKCNLAYRKPKFIPVIFHNLAGYDSHLFIKNLGKTEGKINCIPCNEEKYISFTKNIVVDTFTNKEEKEIEVKPDLRFIDSFKFMASGLGKLVENLSEFPELSKFTMFTSFLCE